MKGLSQRVEVTPVRALKAISPTLYFPVWQGALRSSCPIEGVQGYALVEPKNTDPFDVP